MEAAPGASKLIYDGYTSWLGAEYEAGNEPEEPATLTHGHIVQHGAGTRRQRPVAEYTQPAAALADQNAPIGQRIEVLVVAA